MTYIYQSPDYSYCYRGYEPIQRALRRNGIKAEVYFDSSSIGPLYLSQMRIEAPLGTPAGIVNAVVTRAQKKFPARPYPQEMAKGSK